MRCSPETIYHWDDIDAQQGGAAYCHLNSGDTIAAQDGKSALVKTADSSRGALP